MTQEQLGRRVGLSRVSVTNVERGRQQVYVHTLCRFAKALDIEPVELVPDTALLLEGQATTSSLGALKELPAAHRTWVERVVTPGYIRSRQQEGDRVATIRNRSAARSR